jgi:ABC-type phosphate/phosphonate transport system substrate-binding protein
MIRKIVWKAISVFLGVAVFSVGYRIVQGADVNLPSLRIGLSSMVMEPETSTDDALAATRLWAAKIGGSAWKNADSLVVPDMDKAEDLLTRGSIELVALSTSEYLQYTRKFSAQPSMAYMTNGDTSVEYVLLVRKDTKIESAKDLDGKRVAMNNRGRHSLAPLWLDTYLIKNRLPGKDISILERKIVNKVSQAILPVFFNQMDAAIVIRSAFDTAATLNPQVGKQLKVLASSPPLVPTIVCMRDSLSPSQRQSIIDKALKLHESAEGLQTFTMFKIDRIVLWQKIYEANVRQLLEDFENGGKRRSQ